ATPFAVLLAALDALLARATGDARICVGVPAANRERAEVAGLIGFFVNTLAIDVDVPAHGDFSSLVARTQRALVDAQMHQDVPFEQVVDALGVPRSASHHPLFQVMAAYGERRALPALGAASAALLPSGTPSAKFDLTLSVEATPDGTFDAAFIYALDLFDADAIERLAARFVTLLADALARPDMPVGDLDWLPAAERAQLLAWNAPAGATDAEPFVPVHARIAAHAQARPDARGVADIDRAFTRGEVDARAARLARHLVAAGVRPEMRVGVALQRSVDLLVALIAVLKSGAAFVPLDPAHPRERLAQIVGDANIAHVLTDGASAASLPELPALRVWRADEVAALDEAAHVVLPDVLPGHAAYAIYTSGSTGKPKGVQHSTGGYLLWAAQTMKWTFDWKPTDVFWCTADIGWVTGHTYITYGPLACGGTQVVFEGVPTWPDAGRFWKMIGDHKVSVFYTAPTAIRSLIKAAEADDKVHPKSYDLSSLRIIGTVGEPINPEAWMWYHKHVGQERCPIVDTWWQTETGGHMITPLPGATPTVPGSCTLPLPGIMAAVVDETGQDVPNGQGGILVVKRPWPAMIRTIWGDPERFKKSYYPEELGGTLYLAGDGTVRDKDTGYFTIMGRIDDVLNVSGHRLGTMEIESALVSHELVAEAAVVGRPDDTTGEAVVAFVVLKRARPEGEEAAALAKTLRDWVGKQIGPIAKPKDIRFGDNLPKTRSGKIMRRLLRSLAKGEAITQDTSTLENPAILEQLAEVR
ncbi:acetate--CoA ligase, partial [Burkholderia cepacia]